MIEVRPSDDVEVSDVMPEIVDICRSIGAATEAAMVSALAPGKLRLDLDGREVDRRQRGDAQQAVGEHAEDDDRRRHQRGEDRTADTGFGQTHGLGPRIDLTCGHPRSIGQPQLTFDHDRLAAFEAALQHGFPFERAAQP